MVVQAEARRRQQYAAAAAAAIAPADAAGAEDAGDQQQPISRHLLLQRLGLADADGGDQQQGRQQHASQLGPNRPRLRSRFWRIKGVCGLVGLPRVVAHAGLC
jgi:hypothetical protein